MKKTVIALAVLTAALFTFTAQSQAGYRHYNICWMQTNGMTNCAYLPSTYRISGVRKPYCNRVDRCRYSTVNFRLTRRRIRCLSRYINTATMAPGAHATIYAKAVY